MRGVSQPIWHFIGVDTTENDGRWAKGFLLLVVKFSCNIRHKIRSSKVHWCLPIPFGTEVQPHNLIQLLPNPGRDFHIPHHPKFCGGTEYLRTNPMPQSCVIYQAGAFLALSFDISVGASCFRVCHQSKVHKRCRGGWSFLCCEPIILIWTLTQSHCLLPDRIWAWCSLFPEEGPTHVRMSCSKLLLSHLYRILESREWEKRVNTTILGLEKHGVTVNSVFLFTINWIWGFNLWTRLREVLNTKVLNTLWGIQNLERSVLLTLFSWSLCLNGPPSCLPAEDTSGCSLLLDICCFLHCLRGSSGTWFTAVELMEEPKNWCCRVQS